MIARFLGALGARGGPILALGAFAGLLWPELASLLRPLLVPAYFIVVTLALIRLDPAAVVAYGRRPLLSGAVLLWILAVCPLVLWAVVALLEPPAGLATALVLQGMTAPVFASVALALLVGLDAPFVVVATVSAMFLVPLTLPPSALVLLGLDLHIGIGELMLRLLAFVGGSALLAAVFRHLAGGDRIDRHAREIDGVNVVIFIVFAIAIMDGVAAELAVRPGYILLCLAAAFGANLGLQVLGAAAFWRLGRREALTVGFASGNRNLALLLAVLIDSADFDVLVFFAIGQIPILTLPALLTPIYRRLMAAEG